MKDSQITKNIFGLDRYMPEDIKRQIRQECGFGCVICGLAVVQYEHIDPSFSEATSHDPKKIALLCGNCHDRVSRGIWSKERVIAARKTPITFKHGLTKDAFDLKAPFEVFVGDSRFRDVRCIIRTQSNDEWFSIEPPESPEAPPRISAKFYGPSGKPELEIIQNEWHCSIGIWDLRVSGFKIEVRTAPRNVMLRLISRPPHGLQIDYLRMSFLGSGILVNSDGSITMTANGSEIQMSQTEVNCAEAVFTIP